MEFAPFIDVCGWARNDYKYDIDVVTCGFTKEVTSTFGVTIKVDKTIDEISADSYDALAIPGGFEEFNFYEEAFSQPFLDLIREFDAKGKIIASICVGALPVAKSGVLKGRRCTTYHLGGGKRQKQLAEFGVDLVPDEKVVVDRNIITSYCPETAADVAFTLLKMLVGEEKAEPVIKAMGY